MRPDLVTVARKELKHILAGSSRRRRGGLAIFLFPVALGAVIGLAGVRTNLFFPVFFAAGQSGGLVADSIAGERERHTLETLMAAPASAADILYGKLLAAVGYGTVVGIAYLVPMVVTATIAGRPSRLQSVALVAILIVIGSTVPCAVAALCSIRAETLRQAARRTALLNLPITAVIGGCAAAITLFPLAAGVASLVVLAAVDWVLITICRARFQRGSVPL